MNNLNNLVAVNEISMKAAKRVGALYYGYAAGCALAALAKKNGVSICEVDRYDEVMYFVVNYREKITTEEDSYRIYKTVITSYNVNDPIMVTNDKVAALKSYDYLRGKGQKVALLVTNVFQKSVARHTTNKVVRLEHSGLMEIKKAKNGDNYERLFKCLVEIDGEMKLLNSNGFELIDSFVNHTLLGVVNEVNNNRGDLAPEIENVPERRRKFRVTRTTVISNCSYHEFIIR